MAVAVLFSYKPEDIYMVSELDDVMINKPTEFIIPCGFNNVHANPSQVQIVVCSWRKERQTGRRRRGAARLINYSSTSISCRNNLRRVYTQEAGLMGGDV